MKTVYYNAKCYSLDAKNTVYEAVVVEKGDIIFLGTQKEALAFAGENAQTVDLQGRFLYPGFYDSHSHFSMAGAFYHHMLNLCPKPIGEIETVQDAISRLKAYVKENPKKKIYMAWGYNDQDVKEKRGLLISELNEVSEEAPVFVFHVSGHIAYANQKLFDLAGYHKDTPPPEGGAFGFDEKGQLNGTLEENAIMNIPLPEAYLKEMMTVYLGTPESLAKISQEYLSKGITTAAEGGGMSPHSLQMISDGMANGSVKNRVLVQPFYPNYKESYRLIDLNEKMKLQGVKLSSDGSIQCHTAYLTEPYYDLKEECGYPAIEKNRLHEMLLSLYEEGHQPVVHTNGDAAIDMVLEGLDAAEKRYPNKALRPVFIHAQTASKRQLERMKALGAVPSFFHLHVYYWGDAHKAQFLGPKRANNLNPLRWAKEVGLIFTTHCDTPVVPQSPLFSIWSATCRKTSKGDILGKDQVLTPLEALKTYTVYPAYQNHEEDKKGTLEIGKFADFVVFG